MFLLSFSTYKDTNLLIKMDTFFHNVKIFVILQGGNIMANREFYPLLQNSLPFFPFQ